MKLALADFVRLVAVTAVGVGIMWALQALGFGPTWIIGAAAGAGVTVGAVFIGFSLHDDEARTGLNGTGLPEIA